MSFGLGYICAYTPNASTNRFFRKTDIRVSVYSDVLFWQSTTIAEKLKTPDIDKLIDAVDENGNLLYNLMVDSKPIIKDPETLKYIEISLKWWEKAEVKLQELRVLRSNSSLEPGIKKSKNLD